MTYPSVYPSAYPGAAPTAFTSYDDTLSRVLVDVYSAIRAGADADFGATITGWSGVEGLITADDTSAPGGPDPWSLKFTTAASGSGASAKQTGAGIPVTAGVRYQISAWVLPEPAFGGPTGMNVELGFDWLDANGALISSGTEVAVCPVGHWTKFTAAGEAAPNAVTGIRRAGFPGTVVADNVLYVQQVRSWKPGSALVRRSADLINWTTVRGASSLPLSPEMTPVSDYEFTPGAVNYYQVQASVNANPGFESGTGPWTTAGGATLTQSGLWASSGSYSGMFTGDGSTANPVISTELVPAMPGDKLRFTPWLYSPQGWGDVQAGIEWYDIHGVQLGLRTADEVLSAGVPAQPELYVTIPAGNATQAVAYVKAAGTPAGDVQILVDDAALTGATPATYQDEITPVITSPWLKNLRMPFLNLPVDLGDASDIVRPSNSSTFVVVGRQNQVAVTLPRSGRQFTLTIKTTDDEQTNAVHALLNTGDILLLQVPADYTIPSLGGYYSAGDSTETRQAVNWPRRWISVPLTETDAPAADVVGVPGTWQTVINTYATWADLIAAQASWMDVVTVVGSPADVITP